MAPSTSLLHRTMTTALVLHFGIESLRAFMPLLLFGLRDRFGWSAWGPIGSLLLLAIALGIFLPTFGAAAITRRIGRPSMLRTCVVGLVVFRLAAQLWQWDPIGNLVAVSLCLLCFLMFWPPWLATPATSSPGRHRREVALGTLLGTFLSATLHGLMRTYDLIWRQDWLHIGLTVGVLAVLLTVFWRSAEDAADDLQPAVSNTWFAFGPWLFLQVLIFLNLGRLTVLSGWTQGHAASMQAVSHWIALGVGAFLATRSLSFGDRRALCILAGMTLVIVLGFPWPDGGLACIIQLFSVPAAAVLWVLNLLSTKRNTSSTMPGKAHGFGALTLLLLIFLYYAGYDIPLPVDQSQLIFGAILMLFWSGPLSKDEAETPREAAQPLPGMVPLVWMAALLLFLQPTSDALKASSPKPAVAAHGPLRVMTYNLHCGFSAEGYLQLEEQAEIMRSFDADIIALQEVSRGWVINGGVDILAWLAQRLNMEFRYAPTADPLWGNATLSRRPIVASRTLNFPTGAKQQIRRGLVEVTVTPPLDAQSAAPPDDITVINTHFHHRRADSDVRVEQAKIVLDFWQNRPRTLLVGDLNATPDTPEMKLLKQAGWIDSVADKGQLPGYTFRSNRLDRRIDYVWASPDLEPLEATTVFSTASDHLAVVTSVEMP